MSQFTKIYYDYSDAGNYGQSETVYIAGSLSKEQLALITSKLESETFFIPPQVGMEALQPRMEGFPTEDDHVWHKLNVESFEVLEALPADAVAMCTADEFVTRFSDVTWDVRKEHDRLRLDEATDGDE